MLEGEVQMIIRRHRMEAEKEADGRWFVEIVTIPGCLAYGETRDEAARHAVSLALRIIAEQVEAGEIAPADVRATFAA